MYNFFLLLLWPGMSQFGLLWTEVVGAGCCWQGWLYQGRKHRACSPGHTDTGINVSLVTALPSLTLLSCLRWLFPPSPNPPCWPFSTESRIIKIQLNYYMQIKTTGMKNWLFHKLWKLLCSADLYSLHFLCPGPILHDLIVQWSDSHECYWYEWSPCIWVKWFLLGRLTTCPDLWWTVCMVDKSVNWR